MLIVLNNKSNFNKEEFINYVEELKKINYQDKLILCPTFTNLALVNTGDVTLGAQDVSPYDDGAHTGEISARQLKALNVEYVIIGHSERRSFETETEIYGEIEKSLENDLIPILCIGETLDEKENNETIKVLKKQLDLVVSNLTSEQKKKLIVAYEPIWAIGTNVIPTEEEIEKILKFIKTLLPDAKTLYGGSVSLENIEKIKNIESLDGYLLGGVSLTPDKLNKMLEKL